MVSTILLIGTGVLYNVLFLGGYEGVKQLRGEVATRDRLIQGQEAALREVKRLLSEFEGVARLRDTLNLSLPEAQELPQAVNQLRGIAAANNVALGELRSELQPLKPPPESALDLAKGIGTIRLGAVLRGSYASLKGFLGALETNARLFDVAQMEFDFAGKLPTDDFYRLRLEVDTYYQEE